MKIIKNLVKYWAERKYIVEKLFNKKRKKKKFQRVKNLCGAKKLKYQTKMDRLDNEELKEWSQNQPLSILRLDPIDRAILKISGTPAEIHF